VLSTDTMVADAAIERAAPTATCHNPTHTTWVLRDAREPGIGVNEKAIGYALCSRAQSSGEAYPRMSKLLADAGLSTNSRNTAVRALKNLEAAGFVSVRKTETWMYIYRVGVPGRCPYCPTKRTTPDADSTGGSADSTGGSADSTRHLEGESEVTHEEPKAGGNDFDDVDVGGGADTPANEIPEEKTAPEVVVDDNPQGDTPTGGGNPPGAVRRKLTHTSKRAANRRKRSGQVAAEVAVTVTNGRMAKGRAIDNPEGYADDLAKRAAAEHQVFIELQGEALDYAEAAKAQAAQQRGGSDLAAGDDTSVDELREQREAVLGRISDLEHLERNGHRLAADDAAELVVLRERAELMGAQLRGLQRAHNRH